MYSKTEQNWALYIFSDRLYSEQFFLTLRCLDNIQIFSIPVKLEFLYFIRECTLRWCIYSETQQNKALYIFCNKLYSEPISFNHGAPRYYLYIFRFAYNLDFCILNERAYGVGVYTPKQSRKGHCIFFLTDYIKRHFLFTLERLDNIQIFFDSLKYRISIFYMREHMELVYIL